MRATTLVAMLALPLLSAPLSADELRERQLESQVNRLERELTALTRRVEQLERGASSRNAALPPPVRDSANDSPAWLVGTNWDKIKPGMKLTDVIALLGRPTSARTGAGGEMEQLMYALELGSESVLAGSVAFDTNGVTEVHRPEVR